MVLTLMQQCIKEWKTGRRVQINLRATKQLKMYRSHLQGLLLYAKTAPGRMEGFRRDWYKYSMRHTRERPALPRDHSGGPNPPGFAREHRTLKLSIQQAAHNDVVDETFRAIESGTLPEDVVNDQSLQTLRNRSVNWILAGYHAINKPDIVHQAFRLCAVPETEFNLSYESLTSRSARQAILRLSETDPLVYADIMGSSHTTASQAIVGPEEPVFGASDQDDSGSEYGSDDEVEFPIPYTTRSGRVIRRSSRYRGSN
ncbi:hypothetical protein FRC07_001129 [Ceratobasidium sp. 392]|nr:hypothetical protein FRC07_001129 [Ceratobasidium sp. 392]